MSEYPLIDDEEQTFVCSRCERSVPWSQGADDEYLSLCDDCVAALEHIAELEAEEED